MLNKYFRVVGGASELLLLLLIVGQAEWSDRSEYTALWVIQRHIDRVFDYRGCYVRKNGITAVRSCVCRGHHLQDFGSFRHVLLVFLDQR